MCTDGIMLQNHVYDLIFENECVDVTQFIMCVYYVCIMCVIVNINVAERIVQDERMHLTKYGMCL